MLFSQKTTITALAHVFTSSICWPTLVLPYAALHGVVCPLPLRTVSNKWSLPRQSGLCLLVCWSPHTLALRVTLEAPPSLNFCQNRCLRSCYSTASKCLTAEKEHSELRQLFPKPHQRPRKGSHPWPTAVAIRPPNMGLAPVRVCECVRTSVCVCTHTHGGVGGSCHPDAEPSITGHDWNIITRSALGCPDMLPKEASSFILKQR